MSDDVSARARAALTTLGQSHSVEVNILHGPNAVLDAYYAASEIMAEQLVVIEHMSSAVERVESLAREWRERDHVVARAFAVEVENALRGDR